MKLDAKDPIMIAVSAGVVLAYIILSYAHQDSTRCDVICRFNKNIIENFATENVIGKRSVANLNPAEEEEIKSIIKKVFENQKTIKLGKLTVFIGPNNCGKSQTLKDIASLMNNREQSKIVSKLKFTSTEFSNIESFIDISDHKDALNHKTIVGIGENFAEIEHSITNQDFEGSKLNQDKMFEFYNRFRVVLLNSHNRANAINQTGMEGLEHNRASNLL